MGTRITNQNWIADIILEAYNCWPSICSIEKITIINKCRKYIPYLYIEDIFEMTAFFGAEEMSNSVGNIDYF